MKRALISSENLTRRSPFYALGLLSYRYRWWTIALWTALMIVSLTVMPLLEQVLTETGTVYQRGKAYQAEQLLQQELGISADGLTLVFQQRQDIEQGTSPGSLQPLLQQIQRLPAVSGLVSAEQQPAYRSSDGKTQYSLIYLNDSGTLARNAAVREIEQLLHQHPLSGWQTFLTGTPVVNRDIQQISREDLRRIELLVTPLTLIALLLVFGSLLTAVLPILSAVLAVSVTFGLLYLIALKISVSVFALNLASMLGLGLGIDYSLLIVNRFREELAQGSIEQAIARTIDTAGRAVFFSGLTVAVGLVCLLLFPLSLPQSLGLAGALVVLLSVVTALTVLPALLGIVGKRLQPSPLAQRWIFPWRTGWTALAHCAIRYSLPSILVVLMVVAGLTAPFLQIRFGLVGAEILPQQFPARIGVEVIQRSLGAGAASPILLLVQPQAAADSILTQQHIATLYQFVQQLQADPRVQRVSSLVNLNPQWTLQTYQQLYAAAEGQSPLQVAATIQHFSPGSPTLVFKSQTAEPHMVKKLGQQVQSQKSPVGQTWITGQTATLIMVESRTGVSDRATRSLVKELQSRQLDQLTLWVAGQTAQELDTIAVVYQRFPWVLLVMMGLTFIVLSLLLESIVLPLKAITMNLLSIGASFGSLVFIFQEGHFQHWLQFTPLGYLDILLPLVLFCVLFGLSMDYEVFLLSRMKEAYDEGKSNTESVIQGLQTTGGIITSAALLMIVVTSSFVIARIIFVKALGLGSAIAVLIDITLIRAVLVPATMNLLGEWNWWSPKWMRRSIAFKLPESD